MVAIECCGVRICTRTNEQILLATTIEQLRPRATTIDNLDTINQALRIDLLMPLILIGCTSAPTWMVMHYKCPLRLCLAEGFFYNRVVDFICILDKECIKVTILVGVTRYLNTRNNQHAIAFAILLRRNIRNIQINQDAILIGGLAVNEIILRLGSATFVVTLRIVQEHLLVSTILEVVSNSKNIQAVVIRLQHTRLRHQRAIRKSGMRMKISLIDIVAINLRQNHFNTLGIVLTQRKRIGILLRYGIGAGKTYQR